MSFKGGVKTPGDKDFVTNSLCFGTSDEALVYAQDLARRWILVTKYKVLESDEPVNYAIKDGKLICLEDETNDK